MIAMADTKVAHHVTSREGRVSRNPYPASVTVENEVTSREGRVSRNFLLFFSRICALASRPARGV